jgi:hypothetical protein
VEQMIDWFIVVFGAAAIVGGVRAVRRKKARYDYGEASGSRAVTLGYFWIVLGVVAILGVAFDVALLRNIMKLILTAGG